MAYQPKPNTGSLWPNKDRSSASSPNARGSIFIDRDLLKELMQNSDSQLIEMEVSAWTAVWEKENVKYQNLVVRKPFKAKPKAQQPKQENTDDDDSIPF
jgi:hypothetical protein